MFDQFTATHEVADKFKQLILTPPAIGATMQRRKRAAVQAVHQFEGIQWLGAAFADCFTRSGKFSLDSKGKFKHLGDPADLWTDAAALLTCYVDDMTPPALKRYPSDEVPYLNIEQAARYLGKSVDTVKHHVYRTGRLASKLIGGDVHISQTDLDAFMATPPKRGGDRRSKVAQARNPA